LFIVFAFDLFHKLDAISRKGDAGGVKLSAKKPVKVKAKASAKAQPTRKLRPRGNQPRTPPAETEAKSQGPPAKAKDTPKNKVDRDRIKAIQYADDANILTFASSQKEVIRLQREAVGTIQEWCEANQMMLNEAKTKYQYLTGNALLDCDPASNNPKSPDVEPIGTRGDIVLLGFNLDRNLQFAKLLSKTKGVERAIKRLHFFKMSPRNKRAYYRAFCESHVRYSASLAPGLTVTQKSQLTASCKRALATAIGGFSTCSPPKLFEAGDCHPPLIVMNSALIATETNLTDDPWWVRLKEERPGQLLARIVMPSTYLANIHTELASKGVLRNITKLPRPSAEWRSLPPMDDSKIDDTVRNAETTLSYLHECTKSGQFDLAFTDAAVIKSTKHPPVAAAAIVTWDTHADGYDQYTEAFDLAAGTLALQAETEALLRLL